MKKYPEKILLAWSEAIKGNAKIRDFLTKNGYPELGMFCFALRNHDTARTWLVENKHMHLMALINGVEGDEDAIQWLTNSGFNVLAKVALAGDNELSAFNWLRNNDFLFAKIAKEIRIIKNEIADNNADPHKRGSN
ncbi:MAG: hypothetical protein JKY42_09195 [Flavobacteriales bacterium]|nr:hypothetical protein [Flavobacteriales bacterium]